MFPLSLTRCVTAYPHFSVFWDVKKFKNGVIFPGIFHTISYDTPLGCALFSKYFGHNPVLIDHSELYKTMPSFSKLDNVYLCVFGIVGCNQTTKLK